MSIMAFGNTAVKFLMLKCSVSEGKNLNLLAVTILIRVFYKHTAQEIKIIFCARPSTYKGDMVQHLV